MEMLWYEMCHCGNVMCHCGTVIVQNVLLWQCSCVECVVVAMSWHEMYHCGYVMV